MKSSMNPPSQPTQILIINLHSSRNNGDAALTDVAIQQLSNCFPQSHITLAMNDPDSHLGDHMVVGSFLHWMYKPSEKAGMQWNYGAIIQLLLASLWSVFTYRLFKHPSFFGLTQTQKESLQVYFDADLVVSAPGNFMYSSGKAGLTFLIIAYTMAYALFASKPLYLFPQTIGPLSRARDRKLTQWILNRARLVMVREPISLKEIQQMGVTRAHCRLIPDIAFSFQGVPVEEAKTWLRAWGVDTEQGQPLLGITVINWGAQTAQPMIQEYYEDALFQVANYFLETTHGKVIFFPQVCSNMMVNDDRIPTQRVAERFQDRAEQVIFIKEPTNPELLKTAYRFMDVFIGTRMHSNIFALSEGVPVIAIAYRYKTQGIMQMMMLENWVMDINQVKGEVLVTKLASLWQEKHTLRQHIQARATALAQEAGQAGAHIASDFASLSHH
jgi:colanic acid/amylovoran biosynthesis protein